MDLNKLNEFYLLYLLPLMIFKLPQRWLLGALFKLFSVSLARSQQSSVTSFCSTWKDVPGSSFTFPAPNLEPAFPPKIPGSFSEKCYLEATILIS